MMRVMKKNMNKQSYSRNRTKKRSINRFQPVFISAVFYKVFQRTVSSCDQLPALCHIKHQAVVCLTYRCIYYVGRDAEELTKQIHRFSNMPVDKPDRSCFVIQSERCIFL